MGAKDREQVDLMVSILARDSADSDKAVSTSKIFLICLAGDSAGVAVGRREISAGRILLFV